MKQVTFFHMQVQRTAIPFMVISLVALFAIFGLADSAFAQSGYQIDGVVPDTGTSEFPDPFGVPELGPDNGSTRKLPVIHDDIPPGTLSDQINAGKTDFRKVWMDTNVDASGDVWLYFAWDRNSNTGSSLILFEFQQAGIPSGCNYLGSVADLKAFCNPFANRQAGDFLIGWDQDGSSLKFITRKFTDTNNDGDLELGSEQILNLSFVEAAYCASGFCGEAAINLTDAGIFPASPTECLTVGNVIPGSLTGNSPGLNADYKDIVLGDFASVVNISSCGQVKITKKTTPSGQTGSFPYTLKRADSSPLEYGATPATAKTGTLTGDNDSDTYIDLKVGDNYTLVEGALASPWELSAINCNVDGTNYNVYPANQLFKVKPSITAQCVITNVIQTGKLVVTKELINDNGGTKGKSDFSFTVTGSSVVNNGQPQAFPATGITTLTVPIGNYSVTESAAAGYTTSYSPSPCTNLTVTKNGTTTCTITNNDQPGTLIVKKVVDNDNGGTKEVDDFTFSVNGGSTVSFEADGQNNLTVNAGTYNITEPAVAGYETSYSNCSNVQIVNGATATCTITNKDKPGTLIVKKVVINDDGGTKVATNFTFKVNSGSAVSFEADGQNDLTVDAGTYSVVEPAVSGYTTTYNNCSSVVVANGGTATCTVTNDDDPGTLIVKKVVINDNGGTKKEEDFSFKVDGGSAISFEADGQNDLTVDAGTYSVVEPAVANYTTTYDNCSNVVVANGGTATCTITNDDDPGTLIVKKIVINDNGGTKQEEDFSFEVDGGLAISFEADGQNDLSVDAGIYDVTEPAVTGYTTTYDNCSNVDISIGDTATCTITNDDVSPKLVVIKNVLNNDGGLAIPANFTMHVSATNVSKASFPGAASPGVMVTLNAGSYSVTETVVSGYTPSYSPDCSGTIDVGATKTCTVTNSDQEGTLIVKKVVVNDNGGTKKAEDFTFKVNGGPAIPFEADGQNDLTVIADTYSVIEPAVAGYTTTYNNCTNVVVANGGTATCTITNNDVSPKLVVIKSVLKNDGGTASAGDFTMYVSGTNVSKASFPGVASPGITVTLNAGTYNVTETVDSGYTPSYSSNCSGSIALAETKTCTVTNNDKPATLIVKKVVINDDGGTKEEKDFSFKVNGSSAISFEADGQNNLTVDAGTYSVVEPAVAGYTTTYDNCSNVVIANGGTATCTITNDDKPGTLIVKKVVVNDNGGTKEEEDFSFKVNGGSAVAFEADGQNDLTVDAGIYSVVEPAVAGYTTTYNNCSNVNVANGGTATCTITNDDKPGTLIVKKVVINDNGGTKVAKDFTFKVDGGSAISFEADGQNDLTVDAGTYTVVEPSAAGYTTTYENCANVVIANGGTATCTITNDDQPGMLIVKKVVVNDNGGIKEEEDFSFKVNGGSAISFEADGQNDLTVDAGTYSIVEPAVSGYTTTYDNCSNVVIANGGTATCTITNNDQPGKLVVTKITTVDTNEEFSFDVVAASGPVAGGDFKLTDGKSKELTVNAGTYTATEAISVDWELLNVQCGRVSVGSNPQSVVKIGIGETLECVYTNDPLPQIQVTKVATPSIVTGTTGTVTFTVEVKNSGLETVTLTTLTDTVYGDLDGLGTCSLTPDVVLGPSESYDCAFPGSVNGDEGTPHVNLVRAEGIDDEKNEAANTDSATVTFDQLPSIVVTKTVTPGEINSTSGIAVFTVEVTNNGPVPATLNSLDDSVFGDVADHSNLNILDTDCDLPQALGLSASYSCTFTATVTGGESIPHVNVVTGMATDKEGNSTSDSDDATVIIDLLPDITVTKAANPTSVPETGGDVEFTFSVENNSTEAATITLLTDDKFGALVGDADCKVGTVLAGGASCDFNAIFAIPAGDVPGSHTNVFTATVADDDGNEDTDDDDETVTYTDVKPDITVNKVANPTTIPEIGGNVEFTFSVENNNSEAVTITVLTDDKFGALVGDADCNVGTMLAGGASCDFKAIFVIPAGDVPGSHVNVFTATVTDDDGNEDTDDDDETVTYTDVIPSITVTKVANPTSVPETGGDVEFTFSVTNNSTEAVTITVLTDDKFGALAGDADCIVGTVLGGGASCDFKATFTISASDVPGSHINVFTATVTDDDGNSDTDDDDETVTYTDVKPDVTVTKVANPTSVPEIGGDVEFTFSVTNNSSEAVTITVLTDDKFGALAGDADCQVGTVLAGGASCDFKATFTIPAGDVPGSHVNLFTATVTDDDGNEDTDDEDETVTYSDVKPDITVNKVANPTSVPETGGDVEFTFSVTNNSLEAATITVLTDDKFGVLAGDADCKVGTVLAGGASCDFKTIFTVPAGDASGSHTNVFTATVTDDDGNSDTDDEDETVTYTDVTFGINLTKSAEQASFSKVGDVISYTLVAENTGDGTLHNVVISDSKISSLVCVPAQPATLAPTEKLTCTGSYTVTQADIDAGKVDNTGTVESDETEPDDDDETVPAIPSPALSIDKSGDAGPVTIGDTVHYTITVKNVGNVTLHDVTVTDAKLGLSQKIGVLNVNQTVQLTDSYGPVTAADLPGPIFNTAGATGTTPIGEPVPPVTDTHTVPLTSNPALEIVKTGDTGPLTIGNTVHYTITVKNVGNVTLHDVIVTDSKLGLVQNVGTLNVNQSAQVTGSYGPITEADLPGPIFNAAGVTGTPPVGEPLPPVTDTHTVPVTINPSLLLVKTASPATYANVGDIINYSYLLTNNGNVTLKGPFTVSDDKATVTCPAAPTLAVGASITCTASYVITQADIVAGSVTNIAQGKAKDPNNNDVLSNQDDETVTFDEQPASLGNKVWYDENEDGKQQTGEDGTPGVSVELYTEAGVLVTSQTTKDDGTYLFENLKPGSYYVVFNHTTLPTNYSFTTPNAAGVAEADDSDPDATGQTTIVTLDDGQVNLDVDAGIILRSINITVAPSCVKDAPYIDYSVTPVNFEETDDVVVVRWRNATTNKLLYEVKNQPLTGRVLWPEAQVDASGQGIAWPGWSLVNGQWVDNGSELRPQVRVEIQVNPIASKVVDYPPANPTCNPGPRASLGNRVWYDYNANGQQDDPASEPGMPGVVVELYDAATQSPVLVNGVAYTQTTDENGFYNFLNLMPGNYYVKFTAPQGYNFTKFNASNATEESDSDAIFASLRLSATDGGVEPELGGKLTYTFFYTNTDPALEATNIVFSTTVPAGTTFVRDLSSPLWSCTSPEAGSACTLPLASIGANAGGTIKFVVQLDTNEVLVSDVLDLLVRVTQGLVARSEEVTLASGESNDTVDAGVIRLESMLHTPTPTAPTDLPPNEQPQLNRSIFLPSVRAHQ